MKNILAENLLRFGVKNLKEADRVKLAESLLMEQTTQQKAALTQLNAYLKKTPYKYDINKLKTAANVDPNLKLLADAGIQPTTYTVYNITNWVKEPASGAKAGYVLRGAITIETRLSDETVAAARQNNIPLKTRILNSTKVDLFTTPKDQIVKLLQKYQPSVTDLKVLDPVISAYSITNFL
jgi:hypothetical protein